MIDFKKRLASNAVKKKLDPIAIYDDLDRRSEVGDLREEQKEILTKWWSERKNIENLIIKLHTGKGKTLIGLLILQSRLNERKGPCLYICPTPALVKQTCQDASKFGIPYVEVESDGSLPDEFLNSEKILITHVYKVFNGKSKFKTGGGSEHVETIIFDDSHACIDTINDSFKIKVSREHGLYKKAISLFEGSLREQGAGSFLEIQQGESSTCLPVPYWSWIDNQSEITEAIQKYSKDDNAVQFVWPLIKNNINNCQCFISGRELEISTYFSPISQFGSFTEASCRIFMSATTQNDSFFVKGLNLNTEAIKDPLTCEKEGWSGEKMILIPSLMHDLISRDSIIGRFAKPSEKKRNFGIVCITPSRKRAKIYESQGAIITEGKTVFDEVAKLKNGERDEAVVLVNKYDGIDLPDGSCRILIIDSMPYASSLTESYEEDCRANSNLINIRNAQKIEQGLGRSVRGEKDYSAVLILSDDLVRFLKSQKSRKFFSDQTRKQIDIGFNIVEMTKEDYSLDNAPISPLIDLVNKLLCRDEGWKEFYKQEMNSIEADEDQSHKSTEKLLDVLVLERQAENSLHRGDSEKACKLMNTLIETHMSDNLPEKGWYQQILARYLYGISKTESNQMQKSAFTLNSQLLKPREGINYKKLSYINEDRLKRIRKWISEFNEYEELSMSLNSILENLSFGQRANVFEKAFEDLGNALGFTSQRPDKAIKKGPDNLWCAEGNTYFLIECKSQVETSRTEIHKSETGQMNNHCGWFDDEYGNVKAVTRIMVIPTKRISSQANFTHDVKIMRAGKLSDLRNNVKAMYKELKSYQLDTITDEKLQEFLNAHKLDLKSLQNDYSEEPYFNSFNSKK